ncbi:hypothetical protein DFH27DRAFT_2384 [Peziza echinospora]|nr:hypothetical protein DFH27DRAFT_2384 [Peziza echinospora]
MNRLLLYHVFIFALFFYSCRTDPHFLYISTVSPYLPLRSLTDDLKRHFRPFIHLSFRTSTMHLLLFTAIIFLFISVYFPFLIFHLSGRNAIQIPCARLCFFTPHLFGETKKRMPTSID